MHFCVYTIYNVSGRVTIDGFGSKMRNMWNGIDEAEQ